MYTCQELSTVPSIFKKLMLVQTMRLLSAALCLHWQRFLGSWPQCVPSHQWSCRRLCPTVTNPASFPKALKRRIDRLYSSNMFQHASINQTILKKWMLLSLCAFFPLPLFSASSAASRTAFAAFISLVETNSLLIAIVTLPSMWLIYVC